MFPSPETLDIVLTLFLAVFVGWGFGNGLIRAIGGILAIIVGAAAASRFYPLVGDLIAGFFGRFRPLADITAFTILFLLFGRLFGIVVSLFEKAFDILAILPFLKTVNRVLGAVFGFFLGVLFVGAILYITSKYSIWTEFNDAVTGSQVAQLVISWSWPIRYFFPAEVLQLRSYF